MCSLRSRWASFKLIWGWDNRGLDIVLVSPSAEARTISARLTRPCGVTRNLVSSGNVLRPNSDSAISGFLGCAILLTALHHYNGSFILENKHFFNLSAAQDTGTIDSKRLSRGIWIFVDHEETFREGGRRDE